VVVEDDSSLEVGRERVVAGTRLGIYEGDGLVPVKGLAGSIKISPSQVAKGAAQIAEEGTVLRPGDDALIGDADRKVRLLPKEKAKGDGAGDGIGVRIVVGQDEDTGRVFDRVYERCETFLHGSSLRFEFRSTRRRADRMQSQYRYYTGRWANVPVPRGKRNSPIEGSGCSTPGLVSWRLLFLAGRALAALGLAGFWLFRRLLGGFHVFLVI
jgi:hypothetical protein